jgi:RimJ/RimL family protein N-acetyltransferase
VMVTCLEPDLASVSDGVVEGGPRADTERVVLRDGSNAVIRTLAAGDGAAIANWFANWFAGLGPETLYARLFVLLGWLGRTKSALTGVDRFDDEAIMLFAPDGVAVGIAHYVRVGNPGSAEVTVEVADAWQGRGIAGMLLERVAARARSVGIEQFTAVCLAGSHTTIHLLRRLGPITVKPSRAGLLDVRIDLSNARPNR